MKKRYKRFVSFLTATVMFSNLIPIDELANLPFHLPNLPSFSTASTIKANAIAAESFTPGQITFDEASEFVEYCNYYADDNCSVNIVVADEITGEETTISKSFAEVHQNDVLSLTFGNDDSSIRGTIPSGFIGLGNDDFPFNGEIHLPDNSLGYFKISTYGAPLFSYVNDSVKILSGTQAYDDNTSDYYYPTVKIQFERLSNVGSGENNPLFAQHITNGTADSADWDVELVSSNSCTYSGVVGDIATGAVVNLTFTNSSGADVVSNTDVGAICGTMQTGSTLNLSFSETSSAYTITSASGKAGGLVGTMNGTSALNITAMPTASTSKNVVATTGYAGGLVGSATSEATISYSSEIPVAGNVTGASGAGGLFGHYTNTATAEFDLANYDNSAVVSGTYCGGVFGVLENTASSLTIKKSSNTVTFDVKSGTTDNTSGHFGGIAGKYTTNALANSLIFDGIELTAEAQAAYGAFGGAIGIVDSAAYVQTANTVTVNAKGTNKPTYFGGLIGSTGSSGVFVDLGSFTLKAGELQNSTFTAEEFKGGGIVGQFNKGVLRLSGTTDMTNGKPASADNCGQLVGSNDNVLVYAPGSSWTFKRSNGALTDDLGTWGEVVRGIGETTLDTDAVCFNSTAHTVTVSSAVLSMSSANDFIRTALNIQLNQGSGYDCLLFSSSQANTRATLLASTSLSLGGNISLVGTGITGFMRDGGAVNSIGNFTGTFDGNDYTITLAIGENYGVGSSGQTEGMGQIYRHKHNGLFSVLAGTVKELTVNGTINVSNCVDGMNIGGVASRNGGAVTLTKVIANETINYNESTKVTGSEDAGKNIGGYIGFIGTNGNININGVSSIGATFNLSGSHESWNVYGGAIGKITAGTFTVNIGTTGDSNNKLTNNLKVYSATINAVGTNSDGGGLIGYIKSTGSYADRNVNINNLEFSSSCIILNAASSTGGGFLGYAWLNTTTTIDGLTASGTINNTAASNTAGNVGVLLYSSTGKMTVNSLSISGLTMSSGGGTSLGMIVNKAYTLNDKSKVNGALYLDVLNSGYGLTCTAPTSASGVFDEIAAYSAPDVISGGAGVVSINMNAGRKTTNTVDGVETTINDETKITITGTYQNRLKTSTACANSNTRYYYNVDNMSSSDAGQNLVLWSLSKYAYSGISGEFGTTLSTTLSGTADMTGLSYYPIKDADNYTIGNLTLTLDYSGIYTTAETVSNGDSYIRDPGLANQHYLMHSGLFVNLPTGKTITVTGKLSLGGTFLELSGSNGAKDGYSGVLVSKTMNGSFVCQSGSIELAGITPKTTANAANTSGYLLINNITRESDTDDAPQVIIHNLYTTNAYTGTLPVTSSLLGDASGNDLTIKFSHVKLDARSAALSNTNANNDLTTAYGTSRSIFYNAVFLHSIKTNKTAILEYYYTYAEDWQDGDDEDSAVDRFVTYGKEVKDTEEYKEETTVNGTTKYISLENMYSGAVKYYTNPESNASLSDQYNFSSGWLPYVNTAFTAVDENDTYYRELKVNVEKNGPLTGCGTYNHPYVISGGDLTVVANFISSGSTSDMQKIRLPKTEISGVANNAKGDRWCASLSGCAEFELATSGTNAGKYVYTDASTSPATVYTWTAANVRLYLASAYYKINSNITLGSNYLGLGCATASATGDYAFRGVIVGEQTNASNTAPKWTITNNSPNPLIKVSNGSVVKDVNVTVDAGTISLSQSTAAYNDAYFGYYSQCQYYGGMIGEIMGGDNIIDNSYVKYSYVDTENTTHSTSIQLTDNNTSKYGTIVPVGGYVGVVVFGGLVFKNMTAANTTLSYSGLDVTYKTNSPNNLADNSKQSAWAAIYVNPIVGRVINGYAVNETTKFSIDEDGNYHDDANAQRFATKDNNNTAINTDKLHTLKNGTKHYPIADIKKDETQKLSFGVTGNNNTVTNIVPTNSTTDGTINIPNSQAFFILSLITQSCAGTAQTANGNYLTSLSYGTNTTVYGMSHNAEYSDVGKENITTSNTDYRYASDDTAANTAVPYIIRYYTKADSSGNYPARCVTSTLGYYDINLTGKTANGTVTPSETAGEPDTVTPLESYTYQLPDSFRGLGSVGFYDYETTVLNNKYSMKVDTFTGNNCTIDQDIYLNKFKTDNYFDTLHKGVNQVLSDADNNNIPYLGNTVNSGTYRVPQTNGLGLFNSFILKTKVTEFTLTGSVNTEIYSNTYAASNQEQNFVNGTADNSKILWLSSGGVCGWIRDGVYGEFSYIDLDDLVVSGADFVGGIIGFSGLSSTSNYFTIKQCNANNVSVEMTSARNIETTVKARNAIGCFVGKIQEGAVHIYGTSSLAENNNLNDYSTVKIKSFKFADTSLDYYTAAGGLVGFAGNGCKIYDMKVMPSEGYNVTIGDNKIKFVGGMVGAMQSKNKNETTGVAFFKNCTVERININGNFAGGFYGGKWDSEWTTFTLTFENCKMIGSSSSHNTIVGNNMSNNTNGYAGGFIGRLYPYTNKVDNKVTHNVLIKDCKISNYDITATNSVQSYVGGFIGYANSAKDSVTCYLHDSSIENCTIGGTGNYAGGIIGKIEFSRNNQSNELLGYNIKLDTITMNGSQNGAWIGHAPNDDSKNKKKTSIQFTGMAIYGNGITKNVGNNATIGTASFVFADYTGACNGTSTEVTASKQEGDTDSVTESYSIDTTNKKITRTIVTVTFSGNNKKTRTQAIEYRYGSAETGNAVAVEDGVAEDSITWSISESEGKIYKVVADASTDTKTTTTYTIAVSGYNATNNVVMPKYPFVNVNPQAKMGTDEIISGDGAVLYGSTISGYSGKTGDNTMAAKIFYDKKQTSSSAENYSRRYTSFVDNGIPTNSDNTGVSIEEYLKHDVGTDGDRISTYLLENGSLPTGVDNFAVIAITNTDNTETTNLINRYIQLVTNTATDYTDYSSYYNIVVQTCKYNNGKFIISNDSTGLTWTPPATTTTNGVITQTAKGSFALNGANADSGRTNTFTLIDVQFKDPFHTDDIAYHLYVPVYTVKQMAFGFSAAALTDTNSVSYSTPASISDYETAMAGTNRLHVDSLETWVTQYIRYTYTAEDLNILLSGNNVKWNHDKYVTFDTQSNSYKLPNDTYMVLVDPNGDADKVYYASASDFDSITTGNGGWLIELTKFNRIKGNDATAFSVSTFNQMIAKQIDEVTPSGGTGSGMYNEVTFAEGHTVTDNEYDVYRIDSSDGTKHYYSYVGGSGSVDLAVPSTYVLNEDYYISMYVPKISEYNNELYYYTINSPELLTGTKSAARTSNSTYNVLVADLYDQTTTYTLTNTQEQITDTNNHIDVSASTTIHLTNSNAAQYLNNKHLHQAFDVLLNCYGEDGSVINEIAGYDDENSTATYKIGSGNATDCTVDRQDNYILFKTTDVMSDLLNANGYTITVSADISMKFSDIEAEFPEKTTSNPGIGVNVSATSNLAYEATRLPYTSMSKAFDENPLYYYRESVSVSILSYKAVKELDVYDTYGKDSKNYSRLGINGKTSTGRQNERTAMLIDSEAILNASAIEDSAHATTDKIRLTLTLNKKTDTKVTENEVTTITKTDYVKVSDISNYLSGISVNIGGIPMTKLASSTNDTFIYEADISPSDDKVYTAEIEYYVITGSGFTEYANYQVVLQAELLDSNDASIGNKPSDYLVYTNAKVYPTVIEASKLTG